MLKEYCGGRQVYLVTGYTDMRKAIDGLAAIVEGVLGQNPCSGGLYLFCGKRRDRLKALVWEKDGYVLLYKRLNNGVFQWPRNETQARELTAQQVRWLLEGLSIEQPKAIREGIRGALY